MHRVSVVDVCTGPAHAYRVLKEGRKLRTRPLRYVFNEGKGCRLHGVARRISLQERATGQQRICQTQMTVVIVVDIIKSFFIARFVKLFKLCFFLPKCYSICFIFFIYLYFYEIANDTFKLYDIFVLIIRCSFL